MSDADLVWLRPLWLWGFLPLVLVITFWYRRSTIGSAWERVVDPKLQQYVLDGSDAKRRLGPWLLFSAWILCLLLLAGPVWEKQEVPVFQANQAEVVLFDLSSSMQVDDIAPSRLTRARFKLTDLLADSDGHQIGLIAFAERPYVISPLTEDTSTIEAFLPSLTPDIMPVQGSRLDLAIDRALELLAQTGVSQGHILYMGDQMVSERDFKAAQRARDAGHRLSILAIGTASGKPLRDASGQFTRDASGSIVVPSVSVSAMKELATIGGGTAVSLTTNDEDLQQLARVRSSIGIEEGNSQASMRQTYWVEYSPWLVWPLLLGALTLFRRGVLV